MLHTGVANCAAYGMKTQIRSKLAASAYTSEVKFELCIIL